MMKLVLLLIGFLLFSSCSNSSDDEQLNSGLPQEWELIQVSVGISGDTLEEENLPWQETYTLNRDSTFVKTRELMDETLTASGTFSFTVNSDEDLIIFSHNEGSELVENCNGTNEEWFSRISETEISGGAIPCDGPSFLYQRIR